ncbi:hypothetical protein N0V91_002841 [Didymella pomorum]|uniref:N-acetyltransferase domain-containing protein n=1 Tax=Didymella pomorum TaxID=749634 RepID=A0A9W8ZIJ6_9PLEO|nr:hypothetical protein N0V91_002841 [Didymella pomorum]
MPSFEVQPCTEADIPRVFEIISLAFANDHEYMDAIFPAHGTPEGRRAGSERMLQIFQGDPYGNFTKVIDKDTGKIAGAAKWNLYKNGEVPPQPAIGGDYWDSEDDKEFAQALFHNFFAMRQKVIQETNGNLVEGFDGPYYVVPVPEKFAARRKQVYYWMRRPAQKRVMTP